MEHHIQEENGPEIDPKAPETKATEKAKITPIQRAVSMSILLILSIASAAIWGKNYQLYEKREQDARANRTLQLKTSLSNIIRTQISKILQQSLDPSILITDDEVASRGNLSKQEKKNIDRKIIAQYLLAQESLRCMKETVTSMDNSRGTVRMEAFLKWIGQIEIYIEKEKDNYIEKPYSWVYNNELAQLSEELVYCSLRLGIQSPERAIPVIVSSIRSFGNRYGGATLQYDESKIKHQILTNYQPPEYRLMSNTEGQITRLSFSLDGTDENLFYMIMKLLEAKKNDPGMSFDFMYTNSDYWKSFADFLQKNNFDFNPATYIHGAIADLDQRPQSKNGENSKWNRDGAVVLESDDKGTSKKYKVLEPRKSNYNGNYYDELVFRYGEDMEQTPLRFEGGNIRSTASYAFVGFESLRQSAGELINFSELTGDKLGFKDRYPDDLPKIVSIFEKAFGKKVIGVALPHKKNTDWYRLEQGFMFHIDMMMTPINDNQMTVADLKVPELKESNCGKCEDKKDYLDKIARDMQLKGFEVTRIPYLHIERKVFDREKNKKRIRTFMLTYNNVLIEEYVSNGSIRKKVYLPAYYVGPYNNPTYDIYGEDLNKYNNEARRIYEKLGLDVVTIPVPVSLPFQEGVINCTTFETARRELR